MSIQIGDIDDDDKDDNMIDEKENRSDTSEQRSGTHHSPPSQISQDPVIINR